MASEIRGVSSSGTLYARLLNRSAQAWNTSTLGFESYSSGNYANYSLTMTEQGNSGVYIADFPSSILTAGTYEYFVHRQGGGSPAEGDTIINTGKIDWTGTNSVTVTASAGAMTGLDFRDYVLRLGFKRTDKDSELYEATTDAIQEFRRRYMFDEAEADTTTTDTISVLGDFKLDIESNLGLILSVTLQDGTDAVPLSIISKAKFDKLYPDINVTVDRGYPKHACLYAGQIYLGPIPDSISYTYRLSYSLRAGTITSASAGVPFTNLYRDVLADNVLMRLYRGLEEYDKADRHEAAFEKGFLMATRRENMNSKASTFMMKATSF